LHPVKVPTRNSNTVTLFMLLILPGQTEAKRATAHRIEPELAGW
jgi:hypothetical protein